MATALQSLRLSSAQIRAEGFLECDTVRSATKTSCSATSSKRPIQLSCPVVSLLPGQVLPVQVTLLVLGEILPLSPLIPLALLPALFIPAYDVSVPCSKNVVGTISRNLRPSQVPILDALCDPPLVLAASVKVWSPEGWPASVPKPVP